VRAAADQAVEALAEAEKKVKADWDDDLKKAYRELEAQAAFERNSRARQRYEKAAADAKDVAPDIKLAVQKVKVADDEAESARLDAEATFDEAERRLNTGLARVGTQKAVDSWDLRMKAIRKAEGLVRKVASG